MIKLKTPIIETHTFSDIPAVMAGYHLEITDKRETDSTCNVYDADIVFVDSGLVYSNESIDTNTEEEFELITNVEEIETEK